MSADIQTILIATDFSAAADGVREHFQTGIASVGRRCRQPGGPSSRRTAVTIPT